VRGPADLSSYVAVDRRVLTSAPVGVRWTWTDGGRTARSPHRVEPYVYGTLCAVGAPVNSKPVMSVRPRCGGAACGSA
jgi:hypothetical protein